MTAAAPTLGVQLHALWDLYWDDVTPRPRLYRHIEELARHGVKVVRIDVGWSASQRDPVAPDPDYYYNRRLATAITLVGQQHMEVLLTVQRSPDWSRRPETGEEKNQYPTDPVAIRPWLRWLAKSVDVLAIEIWNEPNLWEFTRLRGLELQVTKYVPVLREAYEAIKSVSDVPVAIGGPSQVDDEFLRGCYEAGARDYFDVMAVHPYQGNQTVPPEDMTPIKGRMTHLAALRALMEEFGDSDKPLWATEFGYSVHAQKDGDDYGLPDDKSAADYLVRSFDVLQKFDVALGVVYCAYRDDPRPHRRGYSLLNADGSPKAQLEALGAR